MRSPGQQMRGSGSPTSMSTMRVPPLRALRDRPRRRQVSAALRADLSLRGPEELCGRPEDLLDTTDARPTSHHLVHRPMGAIPHWPRCTRSASSSVWTLDASSRFSPLLSRPPRFARSRRSSCRGSGRSPQQAGSRRSHARRRSLSEDRDGDAVRASRSSSPRCSRCCRSSPSWASTSTHCATSSQRVITEVRDRAPARGPQRRLASACGEPPVAATSRAWRTALRRIEATRTQPSPHAVAPVPKRSMRGEPQALTGTGGVSWSYHAHRKRRGEFGVNSLRGLARAQNGSVLAASTPESLHELAPFSSSEYGIG